MASGRAIALMGETFDLGDWLGEDVEGAEPLTDNLKAAFESALSNGILDENWITSLDAHSRRNAGADTRKRPQGV